MNKLQKATKLLSEIYDMSAVTVFYDRHPLSPVNEKVFYLKHFGEHDVVFIGPTIEDVKEFVEQVKEGDYYDR